MPEDPEYNDLALEKFEAMLRTNEIYFFDSEEFEDIIQYYLDEGRITMARKAIKIAIEQHPNSIEIKLLQAELLIFDNKLDEAERSLDILMTMEPFNEDIYIHKANLFSKREDHQQAIVILSSALEFTEERADILSLMGMEYLFLDDLNSAKNCFLECLQEDSEDFSSLYNLIYCFDFLEDHEGAILFLNDYLEQNPYSEVAWHQLGKEYYHKKMYSQALTAFDFAVICDDTFVGAYLEKGKVLEKLGRYNEAIENYEITLGLDDPTSYSYLRLGKCHEKLGNDLLAVDFYGKTVHEDPLLDKGWIAITDFYMQKGNHHKALYYINKALQIDSDNALYWIRCAQITKALQLFEEADLAFQRAVDLGNYELQTLTSWVDVLMRLGELDTAAEVLEQARLHYPDNAELNYRLSGLYFLLADLDKGHYFLHSGLKYDFSGHLLFKKLFPSVFNQNSVRKLISDFKRASD